MMLGVKVRYIGEEPWDEWEPGQEKLVKSEANARRLCRRPDFEEVKEPETPVKKKKGKGGE